MSLPTIVFMWEQFGAYHLDRLEAAGAAFAGHARVVGVELGTLSSTYVWDPIEGAEHFERRVLFPTAVSEDVPWRKRLLPMYRAIVSTRPAAVFLCNQDQREIMLLNPLLRLRGIRTYAMLDGKFDDSPRSVVREALKHFVFRLYSGGLVAGARHQSYYRFLGLPENWSRMGYDTVSNARIRAWADRPLAPEGRPFADRDFVVVARFVPKKNLFCAIRAFARMRASPGSATRRLILCGSGKLEPQLRAEVARLRVDGVVFTGFLNPRDVCRQVADGLALVLPSVEEQWGLVVNEAVALGVPILCSDNVGARDSLVRVGVNGFVFEPDNDEGLGQLMRMLSEDEALWRRLCDGSHRLAPAGDVAEFVAGVSGLTGIVNRRTESLNIGQLQAAD